MRKLLSILLALILVFSLCACGAQDTPKGNGTPPTATKTETPEATANIISKNDKTFGAGSIVRFGAYEQDNNLENGKEPIDWLVLEVQNGKALLLSNDILDAQHFHPENQYYTWEQSSLRQWLNVEFYTSAFDQDIRSYVLLSDLQTFANAVYESRSCPDTQDHVFLLSCNEADRYFRIAWGSNGYHTFNTDMTATPTAYALAQGLDVHKHGTSHWLLRSPGWTKYWQACVVAANGGISSTPFHLDEPLGVRPAIWIDLNAPLEIQRTATLDTDSGLEGLFPADWDGRYILEEKDNCVSVYCKKAYESLERDKSWLFSIYVITDDLVLPDSFELGTLDDMVLEATMPWDIPQFSSEDIAAEYTDMIYDAGDILDILTDRIRLMEHLHKVQTYGYDLSLYSSPEDVISTGVYQLDCSNWSEESKQELLGTYNHTSYLSIAPDGTAYLSLGSHEPRKATLRCTTATDLLTDEPDCLFWFDGESVQPAHYEQLTLTIHGMEEVDLAENPQGTMDGSIWTYVWVTDEYWTEESLRDDIG